MAILNRQTGRSGPRKGLRPYLMRGELTTEEVRDTAPEPEEGFTVRTTGPGVGRPARNVLSTGFAPDEGREAEVAITRNEPVTSQITRFNRANIKVLGTPGADMAIGGWHDPSTGIVGMDTSVLTPRTREGMRAAMHIGVEGRQAAIGNLGAKGYEGDIEIPHYLQRGQYQGPQGYAPAVTDGGVSASGRRITRITPGRQEMIDVEADLASQRLKFKDKPVKGKGAGQYVKESLTYLRRTRRPAR